MRILVTGGAGFIGSALVRYLVSEIGAEVLNVDKLTYAGNLASLKSIELAPNYQFLQADICDRGKMQEAFGVLPPGHGHASRRREPRRSIDLGRSRFRPDQRRRHIQPAGCRAALLGWPRRRPQERLPLPACLDRRSLRLARRRGSLRGDDALRSVLALLRLQGRERPSGDRLAPHLRPAGRRLQLLQQLRPLPLSRKSSFR